MDTAQELAEAEHPDSPVTVSSPMIEETGEGTATEEDSNLRRSKSTQAESNCLSQAIQTGDLSQERV